MAGRLACSGFEVVEWCLEVDVVVVVAVVLMDDARGIGAHGIMSVVNLRPPGDSRHVGARSQ